MKMMGAAAEHWPLPRTEVRLAESMRNPGDRPHYVRGQFRAGVFTPTGRQESHALFGLSRANALVRVGADTDLQADDRVNALTWE